MRLRWTRRALGDLERLADRIASDDKPLAARAFATALAEKVARLERFPLLGRTGAYGDTRELIMHRNYLVTYRLSADEVQVLQVWHVARERRR
jgi:toxin ParE1/3/4